MVRKQVDISPNVKLEGRAIWTLSADGNNKVYGETTRKKRGDVWRRWDPYRSKLGAAILRTKKDPKMLFPPSGSTVVYLGAAHGTTISHIHDHLCGKNNKYSGRLISVDISPRCLRDLNHLAVRRPGIIPVFGDARKLESWSYLVPKGADWLFQDVSQAGQVDIFIKACKRFLRPNSTALLSLKGASERFNQGGDEAIFLEAKEKLEEANFEIVESIELKGYEEKHMLFNCKMN
ncbi:MAG: fibrillarin-like rRNA/tRNA 2'-O-methyltransferase, partial [Candidatus Thermoplasmatota archaeon]|nr:fibrillarin-like rRNA/tRNA 2'-O-methyltransferase [Candidatus Thermoplasmatota archaeon]